MSLKTVPWQMRMTLGVIDNTRTVRCALSLPKGNWGGNAARLYALLISPQSGVSLATGNRQSSLGDCITFIARKQNERILNHISQRKKLSQGISPCGSGNGDRPVSFGLLVFCFKVFVFIQRNSIASSLPAMGI